MPVPGAYALSLPSSTFPGTLAGSGIGSGIVRTPSGIIPDTDITGRGLTCSTTTLALGCLFDRIYLVVQKKTHLPEVRNLDSSY